MIEALIQAGCLDLGQLIVTERRGQFDAQVAFCQPQVILIGDQYRARSAVLGDDDRIANGGVLIGAEIFGNCGGRHCAVATCREVDSLIR